MLEARVCRWERFESYRDYIQNLPLNYRMVVAVSELEELTANEIADILGLSVDVVKIRLHRGRMRLLRELKAHCKPEDWLGTSPIGHMRIYRSAGQSCGPIESRSHTVDR